MRTIKILAPIHVMPNVTSVTTMVLHNIISELKKKVNVHVTWFVFSPDTPSSSLTDPDSTILSIHDYENALEVLKNEKPDLIYALPGWAFIDHAFSSAGQFLNIPVVGHITTGFHYHIHVNRLMLLKWFIKGFFESSIPNESTQSKKQFMKRGRFFLYKNLFLIRTQRAMKMSILQIIKNFFTILKLQLTTTKFTFDSRFGGTLYFVDNENVLNVFIAGGFDRSRVIVTGNPIYDQVFRKPSKLKNTMKDDKIHVLYAPSTNYEQGLWSRAQRDSAVKEIVKKISENKKEISLVVKIHPSFTILSQYQSLINSIDPSIPVYKNGSIEGFVEDADVILSHLFTSADVYSVLARKPIILCNFFNSEKDPYVQRGLALECTNSDNLISVIHEALLPNPVYEQQRELFIKEFLYKGDGLATERICKEIMKLLNTN